MHVFMVFYDYGTGALLFLFSFQMLLSSIEYNKENVILTCFFREIIIFLGGAGMNGRMRK